MAGQLRVTGGRLLRRQFKVPEAADKGLVRPTPDRVREAIFSILGKQIDGAKVLDIFAGSGAQGIESLSRGAQEVVFVEAKRDVADNLKQNLEKLGVLGNSRIFVGEASRFLGSVGTQQFDVIFLDPPFALALEPSFWASLKPLLAPDGVIVFRAFKKTQFATPAEFELLQQRNYGSSAVYFLTL